MGLHRAGKASAEFLHRELQRQTPGRVAEQKVFSSLNEARILLEQWRHDYNTQRPHSRLGWLTPSEFTDRSRLSKQWPSGAALPEGSAPIDITSIAKQGNHAVETLPKDGS